MLIFVILKIYLEVILKFHMPIWNKWSNHNSLVNLTVLLETYMSFEGGIVLKTNIILVANIFPSLC